MFHTLRAFQELRDPSFALPVQEERFEIQRSPESKDTNLKSTVTHVRILNIGFAREDRDFVRETFIARLGVRACGAA